MKPEIERLLSQRSAWLHPGQDSGFVVSSRIRLARNLKGSAFPGWAGEEECERIWVESREVLAGLAPLQPAMALGMEELDELERQILFERHLISGEQMEKGRGSGVVIRPDESLSVMVNEEDHLRLQAMRPGFDLRSAWQAINELDTEIESRMAYAFSNKLGYLTACPTNVGTGLRASVMLHLPGLLLLNEMNAITKGLGKIGLAVRGLWGEGTEATGHMFQISNQITLGDAEENMVSGIEQIVQELLEHEKNARQRLLEKREPMLRDHVGRAFGILSHAHILTSKEALDYLSALRLGTDLGILPEVERAAVDELMLIVQPAHLQKVEGKSLKTKERDRVRARLVRQRLAGRLGRRGTGTKHE